MVGEAPKAMKFLGWVEANREYFIIKKGHYLVTIEIKRSSFLLT